MTVASASLEQAPYVLIAEPDLKRAAFYRQLIAEGGFDALVARDGEEAKDILLRRGAPLLLLAELSLPLLDGFALLAELRQIANSDQCAAVVTSSFADLRGVAHELRDKLGISDVMARNIPVRMLRASLTRALDTVVQARNGTIADPELLAQSNVDEDNLAQIAVKTARRYHVPIVAVYLKLGHKQRFVVHVALDAIPPRYEVSNDWALIRRIIEVGEPLVIADARNHPFFAREPVAIQSLVRGFAGAPIMSDDHVVFGAICLMDVRPLALSAFELDSVAAFGRRLGTDLERRSRDTAPATEADRTLLRLALTDALTGLANRRAGEEAMARELARAQRTEAPVSYVFCDVDQFKSVNDTYGHAAGDRALREISKTLVAALRGSDLAIRWGGDEFLLVLPAVDVHGAKVLAERVRAAVEQLSLSGLPPLAVSCGVAQWRAGQTMAEILDEADARLREDKIVRRQSKGTGST